MKSIKEINKNSTKEDYNNFNKDNIEKGKCPLSNYISKMMERNNIK